MRAKDLKQRSFTWVGNRLGATLSDIVYAILTCLGMGVVVNFVEANQAPLQLLGSIVLGVFGYYIYQSNPVRSLRKQQEKKLSFTKTEEVYKRAQQMAKKGRAMTFQWRGGYLTREVLQELLELIRKAGEERQKTARISFNWPQAVIHFSYVENAGIPEPEVVMEDANEGEQFDTGE